MVWGSRDIYILSLADKSARCLTCGLDGDSYFPSWSPDGSVVAFTYEADGNTDIYIINKDGTNPRLLIENGMFPSWSRK